MAIPVKLDVFEGPLDLLMHLIDVNKIDIYDIPIVLITEQYLDYIRKMEKEDMAIASEFLVMAATVLDIKCRMLLPVQKDDEEAEEDPRDELVRKLLEYKMYKYMSQELKEKESQASRNLYREKHLPAEVQNYVPEIDYAQLIGDTTLQTLQDIFASVLERARNRVDPVRASFGDIEKEEINMDEKNLYMHAYIREHKRTSFRALLEKQGSRSEVIVVFLLLLDMIRSGEVTVSQDKVFGDIIIEGK
ncbi:MAG: segregation/condensation protein A [Lachnospiraceae bacterium]|nr:segregation/condensation protein A [Lachnospiraceae bacterium]